MANNSPTIVAASLSDDQLKTSINNLVAHVDEAMKKMVQSTNNAVGEMEAKLKSLGNLKIDSGGSADGGASKRAKAQNAETDAVEKNVAARDKQIKKNQEAATSFDNFAKAQQVAIRSASPSGIRNAEELQTMNIQLDLLRERLREARQQYSSFVALAAHATTTGDKGLFQYATDGVHRYEQEVRSLIPQIRTLQSGIQQMGDVIAPQGHTIQNYVNSLQKANPELAALNAQYKSGTSLLQDQSTSYSSATQSAQRYTEEIRKQAQAIRESAEYKAGKDVLVTTPSGYDAVVNIKDRMSIEDKLTETYQKHIGQKSELDRIEQTDNNVAKERLGTETAITNEISKRKKYSAPEMQVGYDVTRDKLAQIIATRNNIERNQVVNWDEQTSSIKTLSAALKQYQEAYVKMSAIEINSPFGKQMIADMQVLEMNIQSIRREMSRPIDFEFAKNLPANTLEEISYKTQMLRAYAQGINAETVSGQQELTKVMNIVESLGEKAKNLQKTTKQIQQEANSTKFDKISQMPTDSIKQVSQKIKEVRKYISELKSQPIVDEKNLRRAEALFDRLTKQAQKLNSVQGTDKNVNRALKQQANTLDEISQKMQRLQAIRSHLNIETQKSQIDRINAALAELKKQQDGVLQRNQQMIASNTALGRSWNYMKNRLAFYFTVGASTQFVKNIIDIRGQYELLERSIGILIDSAQNGSQIFAELNSMAIKSPFTTMELGAAAKQLVAYDVAAKDVVDTTRRLADMAAAVGIPIERLTYALGQIKAYGYLNARDARMFANAGIPLVKELADRYTELEGRLVSTADVYDRIKKKAISYEDVMATVNKMTDDGGKFFNFQEKAADTLKVRIANLTLAWNNMMNEMGAANQGVLSSGLKTLSDVFKNWRSIYNLITSIIVTFGVLKATQVVVLTKMAMLTKKNITLWAALEFAMRKSIGAAVVNNLRSIGSLLARFSNPLSITAAVVTALGVAIGKAVLDYKDLIAANEAFNKSISDNAKENIGSIEKFFEDYKKQLFNIGGLNNADQEKLWERIQEEIEKTTKNAEDYIRVLNNVENVSSRIRLGEDVLEQSKTIQREIQRLADSGAFSIGGGFANDSAAQNLQNYQKALNEIRQEYGSVNAAIEAHTMKSRKLMADYTTQRNEVRAELNDFVSKLDNAFMPEIIGQSDDVRIQMANVRSFAESLRDAFIATEEGSKIGADGIVLLNNAIDKWITKQGVANNLIVNANGDFDEQRARIEENKTAWEEFFRYVSKKDREYLDAAIKTNNIGSDEVKKIWDKAAEEMSKRATTSYDLIQDQIAQLRNTPDIVINVVYRNEKEKLEKDQEEFQNEYIRPKGWSALSPDKYLEQEKANREKYGTLMRKQGEDTVEYEKRISDERKTNLELQKRNGDIIEENKNKTDAYSQSVTKQAEKEKKAADDRLKAIKEIEDASGYDFSTKSENAAARKAASKAESELAKALKEELSTIDKVRSIYKDLTKYGMSHANAVERATRGWGETVNAINKVLQKNGLQKLDLSKFAGIENPRKLVNMLQSQLNTLLKRGAKPAEIKELQTKIQTLNVDAEKYDLTKITKGLNNELGKLKDEYELAVELDANPEMGNLFADMFGIDTTDFPKTIDEYMQRVQNEFDKARMNLNLGTSLNVFKANAEQWYDWGKAVGYSKEQVDDFKKSFDGSVAVAKKWAQDVVKQTQDLQYKLADNNGKIAIEEEKLANLRVRLANEVNDEQKRLLELQIQDQHNAIAKLKEEILQMLPTYQRLFGEIAEHSARMTRKLARDYKNMLVEGKNRGLNADNTYSVRDPISGQITRISKERMGKEIKNADKELQKTQSTIKKITEAFKKGEDGVVDWVHGVELVGEELEKLGQFVDVVGQIADAFGNPDEYNATAEAIHDISTSLQGASTVAQGIEQFASGDYIGGATSILSGVFTTVSAWMDNSDKKIQQSIKDSERAVSRLELAYTDLEHAIDKAYGADVVGAKRALAAEKELELAELERQLTLERSRKSKNRDEDKIIELQKRIKELRYEIKDSIDEITDDLLGSDVGSFAENLVSAMIESFKKGEDYMEVFGNKFDELIDNMIMKSIVSRVVATALDKLWDDITDNITERSKSETDDYAKAMQERQRLESMDLTAFAKEYWGTYTGGLTMQELYDAKLEAAKKAEKDAKAAYDAATAIDDQDIKDFIEGAEQVKSAIAEPLLDAIKTYYTFGQDAESNLSALQQGLQGVSEETASAVEAYLNGMSQQAYLRNDLLTQIRDTVMSFDMDVQLGVFSQMLLQLQQSYQVQQNIESILTGVLNPSGRAFTVELAS